MSQPVILSMVYQCPICGEREYISVILVGPLVLFTQCLSCGYDGSMVDFITL
jgi:predicted RNA-binding Zn-ribbon protein involved in translation (DUF1610 family)